MSDQRVRVWERRTGPALLVAAGAFLAAYAWPIVDPTLPIAAQRTCSLVTRAVWFAFAVDVCLRFWWSDHRWRFLRHNWMDVLSLAVPMLRPLRALRVVAALNVLTRRGRPFARGRVVATVAGSVFLVALVAALAVLDAERGATGANITTFPDAVWWAATTVTTVGYGDRYPVTPQGRLVAVALMISGVALLGVITAAIASWFVEKVGEVEAAEHHTRAEVSGLVEEVRRLREELARSRNDRGSAM